MHRFSGSVGYKGGAQGREKADKPPDRNLPSKLNSCKAQPWATF